MAGRALRRAPGRPPQALEAVADRPQGAQRLRRLHPRPRGDAQGHAHQACALDAGRLQRPETRPPDADPRPARPPAGHEGSTDAGPTYVAGRKAAEGTLWSAQADTYARGLKVREPLDAVWVGLLNPALGRPQRSEESTYDLKSLIRISYHSFC